MRRPLPIEVSEPMCAFFNERYTPSEDGCWKWTGAVSSSGYPVVSLSSGGRTRSYLAHRVGYTIAKGPIPDGLTLDHLCRNTLCVNPDHLEPCTEHENILRGNGMSARHARKTHCKRGHGFTPENTYNRSDGGRECRSCAKEHRRARSKAK